MSSSRGKEGGTRPNAQVSDSASTIGPVQSTERSPNTAPSRPLNRFSRSSENLRIAVLQSLVEPHRSSGSASTTSSPQKSNRSQDLARRGALRSTEQHGFEEAGSEEPHVDDEEARNTGQHATQPSLREPPFTSSKPACLQLLGISGRWPRPLPTLGSPWATTLSEGDATWLDTTGDPRKTVEFTRFPSDVTPKEARDTILRFSENGWMHVDAHSFYDNTVIVWAKYERMDIAIRVIDRVHEDTAIKGEIIDNGPRSIWTPMVGTPARSASQVRPTPAQSQVLRCPTARPAVTDDVFRTVEFSDFLPGVTSRQAKQMIKDFNIGGLMDNQACTRSGRLVVRAIYCNPKEADLAVELARAKDLKCHEPSRP